MNVISTKLDGVFEIQNRILPDNRGVFVKTFHEEVFKEAGLEVDFKEGFYSTSKRNVLRGMHFQVEPHDHSKLIYVVAGEILDVAVDIRPNSTTYGQYYSLKLGSDTGKSLYVGRGFAHGFLTLSDTATVVYMTTTVYSPESDTGIRWNSFGFNWPSNDLIISERDKSFKSLGIQVG